MRAVPVVDISDPDATSMAGLDAACRDHGFFLLVGHGLDALIDRTWAEAERFFDADRAVRERIVRTADSPLGWYDRELTKRRRDHKEVFDYIDPEGAGDDRNQWPDLPGFRASMQEFFDGFADLADRTTSLVHDALGLGAESRASSQCSRATSSVRLNMYAVGDPVPEHERATLPELGDTALGFHTDPGVITLLLQDQVGGLQAESAEHGWIDVPPEPGTVVVNLGDCMQAWSNDRYRAAVHRVQPMRERRRFSIPYFANPSRDAVVVPLPETCADGARYRPFAWRDLMAARAADNYADLGVDDTQVTDFRVV